MVVYECECEFEWVHVVCVYVSVWVYGVGEWVDVYLKVLCVRVCGKSMHMFEGMCCLGMGPYYFNNVFNLLFQSFM